MTFEYKHPEVIHERRGIQKGFVAQDVEQVFPDWVEVGPGGYKAVSLPIGFSALTVEAFREQQKQIDVLRRENAAMCRENSDLRNKVATIESRLAAWERRDR